MSIEKAKKITTALLEKLDGEYLYGWTDEVEKIEDNAAWQYLKKHSDAISFIVFEELEGREPTDAERKELTRGND